MCTGDSLTRSRKKLTGGVYTMTYEEKRQEFRRESFQRELPEKCGRACVGCGGTDGVEYHHIVPLRLGGENRMSNIVPLCFHCHVKAHGGSSFKRWRHSEGRPRKRPPKGYKDVLFRYVHGFIGRKECEKALDVEGMRIYKAWFYLDYLKSNGIRKVKNHVDLLRKKGSDLEGRRVSEIWYYDESHEDVIMRGGRCFFSGSGRDVYSQPEQMTLWQAI